MKLDSTLRNLIKLPISVSFVDLENGFTTAFSVDFSPKRPVFSMGKKTCRLRKSWWDTTKTLLVYNGKFSNGQKFRLSIPSTMKLSIDLVRKTGMIHMCSLYIAVCGDMDLYGLYGVFKN